jgi:serine/threonine-protein kinase
MLNSFLHYQIDKKLGEGGMGVVYHARDTKLKRRVALKFLPRSVSLDSSNRRRFRKEAQAAAALNHPNIAQVYAIEEADDELCIVMEYVEGNVLKDVIDEGELTVDKKLAIAKKIAVGLRAAHQKGIIHRDIKAQNIMIDVEEAVKIMDFGLAYLPGSDPITKTGRTVGTTAYMAPEQLAGQDPSIRSDIWSYGVVLYQLFTGMLPFKGKYEPAVMYSIAEEQPEPISDDIPEYIQHVIFRCLEKDPGNRYQDMNELIKDLDGAKSTAEENGFFSAFSTASRVTKAGYVVIPLVLIVGVLAIVLPSNRSMPGIEVLPIESIGNNTE